MKRKKYSVAFVCFIAVVLVFSPALVHGQSWSAREDETAANREMAADEEDARVEMGTTMSGKVITVNALMDSVSVLDLGDGGNGSVENFLVKPRTSFIVAGSLKDLSQGDLVQIDFYTFKGRKVADTIILKQRGANQNTSFRKMDNVSKVLVD